MSNETEKVKRAALYIRVSSEEQAMHGLSLAAQKEALYNYAKKHGYRIIGLYADEGVTARKKYRNRLGFMRMLRDVEQDQIDVILFIKLDRWFRNVSDYYEVQRMLEAHDVQWVATEERYDTTTANGRLNLNIRLSIAQDESDRTAERIRFVFKDKLRRGEVISGKVPLGYEIVNKKLVIVPEQCEIVRDIFQHYMDTRSIRITRKYMLDTYGRYYTQTGLRVLLQNERYVGKAHGMEDFCEPIISQEQFKIVQAMIEERAQRSSVSYPDRVYLFSGIVFCAECGNRLSGKVIGGKYIYYRCTKYDKMHQCVHKKNTSELVLEDWLLKNLGTQFERYNTALRSRRNAVNKVDIPKVKSKMRKLKELYLNDLIELEEYEKDYNTLRSQLEQQEGTELPAPIDLSWLKEFEATYSKLDRPSKKALWSRTIGRIEIDNEDNFQAYPISVLPFRK